jgi:hypothetical protein
LRPINVYLGATVVNEDTDALVADLVKIVDAYAARKAKKGLGALSSVLGRHHNTTR